MKNKLKYLVSVSLLCSLSIFAACNLTVSRLDDFTRYLSAYKDARKIVQSAELKTAENDGVLLSLQTTEFLIGDDNIAQTVTKKTLNDDITADENYLESTSTKVIDKSDFSIFNISLKEKYVADNLEYKFENEVKTLSFNTDAQSLEEMLGLDKDALLGIGDAKILLKAKDSRIISITITYASANGNFASIVTAYDYK